MAEKPAPPLNVAKLSSSQKIGEALKRSLLYLPVSAAAEVKKFLTPQALATMAAVIALWVASHFIGVGEAIDIVLAVAGALTIGMAVFDGLDHLWKFAEGAYKARSEQDLDTAGKEFAQAVSILGVQAVFAILFKNRPKTYKGGKINVGPKPANAGSLSGTRALGAGGGTTDPHGVILISRLGSKIDRRLAAIHESVHRFLTPKLSFLYDFRVSNRTSSYVRSPLSKFLEEALAETIARVSVLGFKEVFRGISFPVQNGYVTLVRVGTMMIDGQVVTISPFVPELGGLIAGGFSLYGMNFEIWFGTQPPKLQPGAHAQ